MKNRIIAIFVLSLLFVACGKNETPDYSLKDGHSGDATISFTATIAQRSGDIEQTFVDGNSIAVFGLSYNGNSPEALDIRTTYIANSLYTLSGSSFSKSFPQRFLGDKMDFIAYTPYMATLSSAKPEYTLAADQSLGYSQYDVMYAKKSACSPSDMPAPLLFSHLFSKIEFNVSKGASISSLEGMVIKVKNLVNSVEINLSNGTLTPRPAVAIMTPYKLSADRYEMMAIPQTIAAQTEMLEFVLEGESIVWKTTTPINLTASTLVKVNVTVESNYVDVTISGNIGGWGDDNSPINGATN